MDMNKSFKIAAPKVIHETIDGEVVIANLDNGNYYSLEKVGAYIWSAIEKNATLGGIVKSVKCSYKGSSPDNDMEKAVIRLVRELEKEGIITVHSDNIPSGDSGSAAEPSDRTSFEEPVLNKYTDMQDLLLVDPIHEVDETGWPAVKPDRINESE